MSQNPADAAAQSDAAADETVLVDPAADAQAAAHSEPSTEATTDAAAAAAAQERIDPRDFIMKGLAAIDAGEELPGSEKGPEPPAAEEKPAEEDKPQESEEAKPEEQPEPSAEEAKTEDDKPADDSEPKPVTLLSREEIDQKFPRTPHELRDLAANYAAEVQKTVDAYGGEHYQKPVQLIVEGLQNEDNMSLIQGVLQVQGVDGFTGLMYDVMKVALVDCLKNPEAAESDAARYFIESNRNIADAVFKETFGENASFETIRDLVKWDAEGLLNTPDVRKYIEQAGDGEISESDSPEVKALKLKVADLESKIPTADQGASGADTPASTETDLSHSWETEINDEASKAIDDRYISKTILRPLATDSPEIKEAKTAIDALIKANVRSERSSRKETGKLREAAIKGRSGTANYSKGKDALLEADYQAAKRLGAPIEALFNQVYSTSRNGKVVIPGQGSPGANDGQEEIKEPTQTTKPAEPKVDVEKWRSHMVEQLGQMG